MTQPKNPLGYTLSEAARKLGISRQAVHEAIKRGLLEAHKAKITKTIVQVTRGWVIHAEALKKYQVSDSHITRGKKT
jgi:predicted DNA-binding protein YlxM (UPF0122 family)